MKLLPTIFLLLASTTTLFAAAASSKARCQKHHPRMATAIEIFCKRTDLVVPSLWAQTGVCFPAQPPKYPHGVRLFIQATCTPAQWVPRKYCLEQFYHMCSTGAGDQAVLWRKRYGNGKCQKWSLGQVPVQRGNVLNVGAIETLP